MVKVTKDYPIIPLRDVVVFPGIVTTLFVGRSKSIEALNSAMASDKKLVLVAQKDASKIISLNIEKLIKALKQKAIKYSNTPMLSRTHGQTEIGRASCRERV